MRRKPSLLLVAFGLNIFSLGCATKKIKSPSAFLRLGAIKNSETDDKKLGLNITKKLSDQLGYKLRFNELNKEELVKGLRNNKFDFILAPKSLAKDFPMLKEPEGFESLREELQLSVNTNLEFVYKNEQESLPNEYGADSLSLYLNSEEKDLLNSFESLIYKLRKQYDPSEILNHLDLAQNSN